MAVQEELKCSTCGRNLVSEKVFSQFDCPGCGEEKITRCEYCKSHSNKYECKKCEFEGP